MAQITLNSSGVASNGSLALQSNGTTTAVTVDTAQNVGVGVTPSAWGSIFRTMQIGSDGAWVGGRTDSQNQAWLGTNAYYNGTNWIYKASTTAGQLAIAGNAFNFYQAATGTAGNTATFTQAMTLDSSGNLLVGGTSVNESFSGIPTIQGSTNCIFTNKRSSTSSSSQFRFYNPNGQVGEISTSGSATTYGTSSDYRLKENIAPMTGALSVVQQLKPVTYNWKVDGSDGQGFIAHELQAVVPDCVVGEKDAVQTYTDEDGNEQTRPVYQSIDTSFLVATLTAAIQELKALVDTQASTINSLTDRITALEAK